MAWQGRKYKLDKEEGFDAYMKALGVGLVLRKMALSATPTVFLEKNGDEFQFHTVSTFKTSIIKFKLNEEFMEETLDGRKVLCVMTLDGNTLTQTQKMEKPSTITRVFSETELIVTCDYGGVVSVRRYKVIN